eukprot:10451900-Heterocapsa_arctica.AAC.1
MEGEHRPPCRGEHAVGQEGGRRPSGGARPGNAQLEGRPLWHGSGKTRFRGEAVGLHVNRAGQGGQRGRKAP